MATIFNFIAGAGIAQGAFIAILLFTGRRGGVPGNRVLAFLLLALALSTAHPFFGPAIGPARAGRFMIDPTQLLVNPFIWLFVSARAAGRRFRIRDLFHFAPFVAMGAFLMASPPAVPGLPASIIYWILAIGQALAYFIPSARAIHGYSKRLEQSYSKLEAFRLEGLHIFMGVILALLVGRLVGLAFLAHGVSLLHANRLMELLEAFAVYFIGLFMVLRAEPDARAVPNPPGEAKYGKSSLTGPEVSAAFAAVEAGLRARKLYLDPELSLPALADALDMGRNDLSRVINEGGGLSFYDFVNGFRIQEFKALSRDPAKASWKILALAFEAGFNSKPAFNSAFKRLAGTTPSAWMRADRGGMAAN